jgi:hypothetical protein
MTTKTLFMVLLLTGFVAGAPALWWGLGDLKNIPGGVWRHSAQRPRHQWRAGMISAYLLGGWPVIVSVLMWHNSTERANLLDEWAHLSARKRQSRQRAREARLAAQNAAESNAAEPSASTPNPPGSRVPDLQPTGSDDDTVIILSDHEDA